MSFNPAVAVMVLLKGLATPVVLYSDNPFQLYDELKQVLASAGTGPAKLIEKPGLGPLRKVCFLSSELSGVALQMDPSAPVADPAGGASAPTGPAPIAGPAGPAPFISFKPPTTP